MLSPCDATVIREIFVGKIFSWGKSTTKIKRTKILYDEKLQRRIFTKQITHGRHTFTRVAAV